jgi:hypothetical protein
MFVVEFKTTFDDTHASKKTEQHDTAQNVMAAIAHWINASSSESATEEVSGFNTSVTLEIIEALKEGQKITTTNVVKSWEEDDTMIFTQTITITIKRI